MCILTSKPPMKNLADCCVLMLTCMLSFFLVQIIPKDLEENMACRKTGLIRFILSLVFTLVSLA